MQYFCTTQLTLTHIFTPHHRRLFRPERKQANDWLTDWWCKESAIWKREPRKSGHCLHYVPRILSWRNTRHPPNARGPRISQKCLQSRLGKRANCLWEITIITGILCRSILWGKEPSFVIFKGSIESVFTVIRWCINNAFNYITSFNGFIEYKSSFRKEMKILSSSWYFSYLIKLNLFFQNATKKLMKHNTDFGAPSLSFPYITL